MQSYERPLKSAEAHTANSLDFGSFFLPCFPSHNLEGHSILQIQFLRTVVVGGTTEIGTFTSCRCWSKLEDFGMLFIAYKYNK